jgi:hypothetical protein
MQVPALASWSVVMRHAAGPEQHRRPEWKDQSKNCGELFALAHWLPKQNGLNEHHQIRIAVRGFAEPFL